MYVESANYNELYDLICQNNKVICEVDYKFSNSRIARDICACKKFSDNAIRFSVRGTQYGGVDPWMVENEEEEKKEFLDECRRMKVLWYKP